MQLQSFLSKYLDFIDQFIPQSRKTVIGFDIGTSSVKAVEIACGKDYFEVLNWALEPIEGADAKEAIKRVVARMDIKDQFPISSVSGKGTLIRYIDMPRMPIEELRKSFIYEIDKYFPFDPQAIYTDCYIINPQGKEKKASVLVVAAKKELVDDRIKMFKEVGMELSYVTTNSIATANAFEKLMKGSKSEGARAILDIGGSVSTLMILDRNNSPSFTRDIFLGGHDMSQQIANMLRVSLARAEELKVIPGDKFNEMVQACEDSIDNLTAEIHLSLDYFTTERNSPVIELFLVGGGSSFAGIEGIFEKSLNIPVKIWNPLANLRLAPDVIQSDIKKYSSQLGVAIGLALIKV
ncbi:MAG: type IV pilus assembly protein PilM [Candidatus Omnitrophica bacterium]|nr:type IV pilus assembly protein PilM [Candidatus Omnitrophota bacterium]